MKLKSLEISGFKSFADKTKIEFKPGMTGIVGPNGVGKSNIIEALRWAMGEQSAKGLRGEKMQDVIFGGTDKRNPLNRAEVSVIFDNTDHYLKANWSEIKITRKLYRTGESLYQLNGQDARLRDIIDLFMDTGLGKESFSIISQGRVEEIFNSKPSERRGIVEEVAGVYKYKQNKERAEKELKQTQANLERIQDIFMEVSQRIEPLEQQATIAKDYLQQKEQFEQLDKIYVATDILNAKQELKDVQQTLQRINSESTTKQIEIEKVKFDLKKQKEILVQTQRTKEQQQQQYFEYSQQIERLHGLQNVNAQRDENQHETQQQLQEQLKEAKDQLKNKRIIIDDNQNKINDLTDSIANLTNEIATLTSQTPATRITMLNENLSQRQSEYVKLIKQQATLLAKKEELSKVANFSQTDTKDAFDQLAILGPKIILNKKQLGELSLKIQDVINENTQIEAQLAVLKNNIKNNTQQEYELRNSWYDGLAIMKQAQVRLEVLKQLDDDYSGFFQGVKNLLNKRDKFANLIGPVAEVIKVDSKYSKAIETSLGPTLQHILVEDDVSATKIVKYLTHNRLGRVTLLPLNVIQGRSLSDSQLQKLQTTPGFIAVANQLVVTQQEYQKVIDNLLGTTLIATDIETALIIAQVINYRSKVVTLDGQVINSGGAITGGRQRNEQTGLLAQKAEVVRLADALKTMKFESAKCEEKLSRLTSQNKEQQIELAKLQSNFVKRQAYQSQLSAEISTKKGLLEQLKLQESALTEKSASQSENIKDLKLMQFQTNENLTSVKENIIKNQEAVNNLQTQLQQLHANRGALEEQLQNKREALASAMMQKKELTKQTANLNEEQQLVINRINNWQEKLVLLAKTVDEIALTKVQATKKLALIVEKQASTKSEIVRLDAILKEVRHSIVQLENNLRQFEATYQDKRAALIALKGKDKTLINLIKERTMRLSDEYQLQASDIYLKDNTLTQLELQQKLKLLKLGIDELGEVNVNAIGEYIQIKERYEFLKQQQDDLLVARNNLFTTMQEMDSTVKERFKITFKQISNSFERIFEQMFGGGKAQLRLTDEHDLLTTGIDIMAQPPGKKFQQMSLLSGGERALTAITLLFAILDVRPVPFAILDETEAALDDANVARFAQYLHNFQAKTQFIVITHRKGTMINADVLYGITMQESGISKMVSVELTNIE